MMLRKRLSRTWIFLLMGIVLIRLSILWPDFIEKYYARGIYPYMGKTLRFLTGWLPISMGDVLYSLAIVLILRELIIWIRWIIQKSQPGFVKRKINTYALFFLSIYIIFNVLWGLNYNRRSIGRQMDLKPNVAHDSLLIQLSERLRDKANDIRPSKVLNRNYAELAVIGYDRLADSFPIPKTGPISLKSSLFGEIGNYMGYSGYFNPFTGEGQVNTTIPEFMIPFVTAHEIGHQLGYAKEHEASFMGHLAAKASGDPYMQYSSYLNMFLYTQGELRSIDSVAAKKIWNGLRPEVLHDIQTYTDYLRRYDTPIGIWVDQFYNQYLKLNEQPSGMRSYNMVTVWLLAWMGKYGDI